MLSDEYIFPKGVCRGFQPRRLSDKMNDDSNSGAVALLDEDARDPGWRSGTASFRQPEQVQRARTKQARPGGYRS